MFLIEKGRKSPICRECKALHSKAACPRQQRGKYVCAGCGGPTDDDICKACLRRLDRGESMYIDPRTLPMQKAL